MQKVLYAEADFSLVWQPIRFDNNGYLIEKAVGRKGVEGAAMHSIFNLAVLGHTFTKDDRHHLPYEIKRISPVTRVLVLHASGQHPKVDLALDSRRGDSAVLEAIADLLSQPVGA